jgi:cell division protein FtsZ
MIFGSVINESLKDEIIVTVIATGFEGVPATPKPLVRPAVSSSSTSVKREPVVAREEVPAAEPAKNITSLDDLDIPAFLRNRKKR